MIFQKMNPWADKHKYKYSKKGIMSSKVNNNVFLSKIND